MAAKDPYRMVANSDDFYIRFFLGRLNDRAESIRFFERKARDAEKARDDMIAEAIDIGFAPRDIAYAANVPVKAINALVAERQQRRLWGAA